MAQSYVEKMMEKLDSKYALVVVTAKRARQLTDGRTPCVEGLSVDKDKPVSIAMQEIAAGKIKIEIPKGGIK
ncbi:MAG: DNA-directed RNA polymerase subunit omega [Peptococcia bacterium]